MEQKPNLGLVDGNNQPLKAEKKLVDGQGNEVQTAPANEKAPTTKDVGTNMASHLINGAFKNKTNDAVNIQLDVLYWCALNIIAHRRTNIALGFGEENKGIVEWDASRAFAAEKDIQEHQDAVNEEWKTSFFNGELAFTPEKKS